jgi:hypothetical protein
VSLEDWRLVGWPLRAPCMPIRLTVQLSFTGQIVTLRGVRITTRGVTRSCDAFKYAIRAEAVHASFADERARARDHALRMCLNVLRLPER